MSKPPKLERPKLALWMWERDLKPAHDKVMQAVGKSYETIRKYCLPFSDPNRLIPDEETMKRIFAWTGGEVAPSDFYPPELNGERRSPSAPSLETAE